MTGERIFNSSSCTKKGEEQKVNLRRLHRVFAQCWRARQRFVFLEIFYVSAFLGC